MSGWVARPGDDAWEVDICAKKRVERWNYDSCPEETTYANSENIIMEGNSPSISFMYGIFGKSIYRQHLKVSQYSAIRHGVSHFEPEVQTLAVYVIKHQGLNLRINCVLFF